jgi:hypothetical protein
LGKRLPVTYASQREVRTQNKEHHDFQYLNYGFHEMRPFGCQSLTLAPAEIKRRLSPCKEGTGEAPNDEDLLRAT